MGVTSGAREFPSVVLARVSRTPSLEISFCFWLPVILTLCFLLSQGQMSVKSLSIVIKCIWSEYQDKLCSPLNLV